jgi:predicted nucleotidyltransferase
MKKLVKSEKSDLPASKIMIEKIKKVLEKHKEIVFSYLFGSFAKGLERKGSDVDIGIFLRKDYKKSAFYESEIALEIERKTGIRNVEVIVLNDKPLRFINQVLRYGKLIFSRDEKERIKFETLMTKMYIDFKPYYEEYDKLREKRLGI